MSTTVQETPSEHLERLGIYLEFSFNKKWCYKHQFPGQEVIIVSDEDKDKAASKFFVEYLKSLHYSLRYLYEDGRIEALNKTIEKYSAFKDQNIDKTIQIFTRGMRPADLQRLHKRVNN